MHFETIDDLKSHISQRIGDIDQDVDRDAVVSQLAVWVIRAAECYDFAFGYDWGKPYRDVFPEDDWPEAVSRAVNCVRDREIARAYNAR